MSTIHCISHNFHIITCNACEDELILKYIFKKIRIWKIKFHFSHAEEQNCSTDENSIRNLFHCFYFKMVRLFHLFQHLWAANNIPKLSFPEKEILVTPPISPVPLICWHCRQNTHSMWSFYFRSIFNLNSSFKYSEFIILPDYIRRQIIKLTDNICFSFRLDFRRINWGELINATIRLSPSFMVPNLQNKFWVNGCECVCARVFSSR